MGSSGISQSALPYRRSVPQWMKMSSDEVKEQIFKLAKKGLTPSQIGVILRDSHGVAQVRFITGNKILRILKSKALAPDLPEDIYFLIKKAVSIRKHLEGNRTRTPSLGSFWSSLEFIVWLGTTRPRVFFPPPGNTSPALHLLLSPNVT